MIFEIVADKSLEAALALLITLYKTDHQVLITGQYVRHLKLFKIFDLSKLLANSLEINRKHVSEGSNRKILRTMIQP